MILVGADLTPYRAGLKTAAKESQSLGQQIRAALSNPAGFGGTSKIGGLISDLKLGRSLTASIRDAATGLGGTLKGLSVNALHTGLNGVKTVLGGLKGIASDIFKGFSIGLGLGSFQALGRGDRRRSQLHPEPDRQGPRLRQHGRPDLGLDRRHGGCFVGTGRHPPVSRGAHRFHHQPARTDGTQPRPGRAAAERAWGHDAGCERRAAQPGPDPRERPPGILPLRRRHGQGRPDRPRVRAAAGWRSWSTT